MTLPKSQASEQLTVKDVRSVQVEERDGKVYVTVAQDSLVRIDDLVASVKAMRDKRAALRRAAQAANDDWSGASAGEKMTLVRDMLVALNGSVQGLTNIAAWLVRAEMDRMKGRQ